MGADPTKLGTLAAMLLLAALVGCVPEKAATPQALVVYPNAEAVAFRQFGEIWQVYYEVPVAYPAESVLKHINASLERASWQPLKNDFLNPHLPSSHQKGWDSYLDATTKPATKVHQWLAQWKNPRGDVVSFALQYRYEAKGSPELKTLRVHGSHSPRGVAEMQLKTANVPQSSNK